MTHFRWDYQALQLIAQDIGNTWLVVYSGSSVKFKIINSKNVLAVFPASNSFTASKVILQRKFWKSQLPRESKFKCIWLAFKCLIPKCFLGKLSHIQAKKRNKQKTPTNNPVTSEAADVILTISVSKLLLKNLHSMCKYSVSEWAFYFKTSLICWASHDLAYSDPYCKTLLQSPQWHPP